MRYPILQHIARWLCNTPQEQPQNNFAILSLKELRDMKSVTRLSIGPLSLRAEQSFSVFMALLVWKTWNLPIRTAKSAEGLILAFGKFTQISCQISRHPWQKKSTIRFSPHFCRVAALRNLVTRTLGKLCPWTEKPKHRYYTHRFHKKKTSFFIRCWDQKLWDGNQNCGFWGFHCRENLRRRKTVATAGLILWRTFWEICWGFRGAFSEVGL